MTVSALARAVSIARADVGRDRDHVVFVLPCRNGFVLSDRCAAGAVARVSLGRVVLFRAPQ